MDDDAEYVRAREAMVREQLLARDITDPRVLAAMARVPRHRFVAEHLRPEAYDDHPLPIGHGVTISQPYIVALMSELAAVSPGDRVLDVGTGSGYQAAVLAELGATVWGIEILDDLVVTARERLAELGYHDITLRTGDGHAGWPEHAPFDAILVAAAAPTIPEALLAQLAVGGRLVIPVGPRDEQSLEVVVRTAEGSTRRRIAPVMFVPLVDAAAPELD